MDAIHTFPQGHWETSDRKFINKYDALMYATEKNTPVYFRYFNDVWEKFDRSLLGTVSLQELYKQRAQQLRDKYDYLILYFSGGADSYNVLRSFIDNGIKIDEVCVKWCTATLESSNTIYVPNTTEVSARNYLSEWDFAIKPVLDEISRTHPEIKIEIVDWFKDKTLIGSEEAFRIVNHWHDCEVPSLAVWSPSEAKLLEKGKRVGSIYGIDKPMVYMNEGKGYMFFTDSGTAMGTPNPANVYGTEYFYWAPDFPLVTFETANQVINAYRTDPDLAGLAFNDDVKKDFSIFVQRWQIQQKKLRNVLYDNWTDRFQAYKPMTLDRSDKHGWLYKFPELEKFKDSYRDMVNLHTSQLRSDLYLKSERASMYKFIPTKKFFVS